MARLYMIFCVIITCFIFGYCSGKGQIFDENYIIDWGAEQITFLDERREVQIKIDQKSGGGFKSKDAYSSGYFKTSLKIPKHSRGLIATFYLTSTSGGGDHDELDFELLGSNGPPYTLNTNIFAQDNGHREQQFELWFDPTLAFHDYGILWNSKLIVFYVDGRPIRVFKNMEKFGAKFPKLPMSSHATLWNGSQWLGPTDWSRGPFYANYRGLEINGCNSNSRECTYWNGERKEDLSERELMLLKFTEKKYLRYDYCKSYKNKSPECKYHW